MKPKSKLFLFCGYNFNKKLGNITFKYRVEFSNRDPLDFKTTVRLPHVPEKVSSVNFDNFLEPLHLILGISYYKIYCPPMIKTPFKLTQKKAIFWNKVYRKGLGEFLYKNNLDPQILAKFPFTKFTSSPVRVEVSDRAILGIGGGKDSIVAAEMLKNFETDLFLLETQKENPISRKIISQIGRPSIIIQRTLDPKIFENNPGSYNGHIPISAVIAFIGLLTAAVYKYKYVIVGNEQSSNFGNLSYRGETINHQWSKSSEFEDMLQEYTREFITADITYFSILRQYYEIRIAKMFSKHKKYFPLFTSCNRNFRIFGDRPASLWCGECPKCAFVFLMLSAFINKKEVIDIFNKNLFADKSLVALYKDLLGFGNLKPFDCVGTFEESQVALYLASEMFKDDIVVKALLNKIKTPKHLQDKVFRTVPAHTLPTPFRFYGVSSVCILGYGKDGHSAEKYIQKNYQGIKIGILDARLDGNYLARQGEYDLAVKTPGIPKNKVTIPYVTSANIFFSRVSNFIIGVTGSKGKSTTASLIYHILKTAGKKVRLLGNIGNPVLDVLTERLDPDEFFVLELSSFMLDDIEYSPNIAVLLNLFPEHMDYHGGINQYYQAKKRIFNFQKPGDIALAPPFTETIPLKNSQIPLLGTHNLQNIKAAVKVARHLGISDLNIRNALIKFKPLPHRLEFIGTFRGIKYYDDAISTAPESTIEAIKTLKSIGTIFLGGEDRGYDFTLLETTLKKYRIKNVVLFPDSGIYMLKQVQDFNIYKTDSMEKAVKFAFKVTPNGKICLLSTASPSYSLWKNFEEKGDQFQYFVKKLGKVP